MLLFTTTNVYAITSNDVTYDNNGTTENLTESLDTLYNELKKYKTGGSVEANQMLAGVSGYSKGVLVTGTIPSKGATTYTPGTTNQTITSGQYLSGTQTIVGDTDLKAGNIKSGVNLFGVNGTFTSDANAVAGNILKGKTAYVNGNKITGTISSKGATTYTPGTSNQTISSGQYLSGTQTIQGDADLKAGNIKSGVNIFGVTGTYSGPSVSTLFANGVSHLSSGGAGGCTADWSLNSSMSAGTYIVANAFSAFSTPTGAGNQMTFPSQTGMTVKVLSEIQNGIFHSNIYLVTLSKTFVTGTIMGQMYSCGDPNTSGETLYSTSTWVKVG